MINRWEPAGVPLRTLVFFIFSSYNPQWRRCFCKRTISSTNLVYSICGLFMEKFFLGVLDPPGPPYLALATRSTIWKLSTWSSDGHIVWKVSRYPWFSMVSTFLCLFILFRRKFLNLPQFLSISTQLGKHEVNSSGWNLYLYPSFTFWVEKRRKIWETFVRSALCLAAMSEQLKYIVDELNKEPFKRNYNLIRYTSRIIMGRSSVKRERKNDMYTTVK